MNNVRSFIVILSLLLGGPLFADQERGDIEMLSIDARNAAKGGGAVFSSFGQFGDNPALGAVEQKFFVGSSYLFTESFSFAAADNKMGAFAGGLMYDRHNKLNTVKTNSAFQIADWFMFGFNLKFLSGPFYPLQRKILSLTADIGVLFNIENIAYIGASFNDFVPIGDNLPMRVTGQCEFNLYERMFLLNIAGSYHIDHREEAVPNRRPQAAYADFSTGFEFRYAWFSSQIGVHTSSFARDLTFDDLLKTVGVGFYKEREIKKNNKGEEEEEDGGGVYAGVYFTRTFITFAVTFVWEPK